MEFCRTLFNCWSPKQEHKAVIGPEQQQLHSETCEDDNYLQPLSMDSVFWQVSHQCTEMCQSCSVFRAVSARFVFCSSSSPGRGCGCLRGPGWVWAGGRRCWTRSGGARVASPSPAKSQARWWGTGREPAEGVQRFKSSQLPFSTRVCSASSEFRHLHSALSFQNNVGVPDIELCKQVCSQLREELLLPPLLHPSLGSDVPASRGITPAHFSQGFPLPKSHRMAVSYKPMEIISRLFPFMATHLLFPASFDIKRQILSHSHQKQEGRPVSPILGFWLKLLEKN